MAPTLIPARCPIDVFAYQNYREFLSDYYQERKKSRGFSYRAFSRAAGLGAPNYLQLVITGKRNLTQRMAARFAGACGLHAEAATYFERLVAYNQARSPHEQRECRAQLAVCRCYGRARVLEQAEAAYFNTWYIPAIRELCASPGFVSDPAWIARTVRPAITITEARKAIRVLLELGFLKRSADKRLVQGDAEILSTGAETHVMHTAAYHAEMMRRATAAMEQLPAEARDISSLTLCVSADALARLKARIQVFRRELVELAEKDGAREQVVQLNFQLFPLTMPVAALGTMTRVEGGACHA